ncbi:MAG: class I SAM-dependent methyltransferase [archaeon]
MIHPEQAEGIFRKQLHEESDVMKKPTAELVGKILSAHNDYTSFGLILEFPIPVDNVPAKRFEKYSNLAKRLAAKEVKLVENESLNIASYLPFGLEYSLTRVFSPGKFKLTYVLLFPTKGDRCHLFLVAEDSPENLGTKMYYPVFFSKPTLRYLKRDIPRLWAKMERIEWAVSSMVYSWAREYSSCAFAVALVDCLRLAGFEYKKGKALFKHSIDYGTGDGSTLFCLEEVSEKTLAVDPSPSMLRVAGMMAKKHGVKNVSFAQIKPDKIPAKGKTFDCAIAISVLPYVFSQEATIREILRVLKPGGFIMFTDRERDDMTSIKNEESLKALFAKLGVPDIWRYTPPQNLQDFLIDHVWYGVKKG